MPFKSKAQERKFREMEASKEMTPGTADKWLAETRNFDALPERTKPKQPTRPKRVYPNQGNGGGWYW